MKISLKALLVAAIVLMTVLPGAYGMSFGASYGDSQGNRATASATLRNAQGLDSDIVGTPGTAVAGIYFSVDSADYINCGAKVVDKNQKTASVGLVVINARNTYYTNAAGVNIIGATGLVALQQFSTSGATISTTASASDQNGNRASASTVVNNGIVPTFYSIAEAMPSEGMPLAAFEIAPFGLMGSAINSKSTAINENGNKATSSTVTNSQFTTEFYENAAGITNNLNTEYPNEKFAAQAWVGVVGTDMRLSSLAYNENGKTKRSSPAPITTPTDGSASLLSYGLLTSGVPSAFSGLYDGSAIPIPLIG
jgi:hypothetical protein